MAKFYGFTPSQVLDLTNEQLEAYLSHIILSKEEYDKLQWETFGEVKPKNRHEIIMKVWAAAEKIEKQKKNKKGKK